MPDISACQYLTATLVLAVTDHKNLSVNDSVEELLTSARSPTPGYRRHTAAPHLDDAPRVSYSAPRQLWDIA
jgi:hypothetical protein